MNAWAEKGDWEGLKAKASLPGSFKQGTTFQNY